MNVRDTESVAAQLIAHGHEEADAEAEADLVIVKASTWPNAWTDELAAEAFIAFAAVAEALD